MIHIGRVSITEAGGDPARPPFISGHYRLYLLSLLREWNLPPDYVAWIQEPRSGDRACTRRDIDDIEWSAILLDPKPFFMSRLETRDNPGKPWRVHARDTGAIMAYCSTPHEAENVIARLLIAQRS